MTSSAKVAHEAATHEESKAEDKYDTRGLEASYLAGAQAKRAAEIQSHLKELEFTKTISFSADDTIAITAVVIAEQHLENKIEKTAYFLARNEGGFSVQVDGQNFHIISVNSPLGREFVGRTVGEEFDIIHSNGRKRHFSVSNIY